jgi:hypothetical protein
MSKHDESLLRGMSTGQIPNNAQKCEQNATFVAKIHCNGVHAVFTSLKKLNFPARHDYISYISDYDSITDAH